MAAVALAAPKWVELKLTTLTSVAEYDLPSLQECCDLSRTGGRGELLLHLREAGVKAFGERRKIASAVEQYAAALPPLVVKNVGSSETADANLTPAPTMDSPPAPATSPAVEPPAPVPPEAATAPAAASSVAPDAAQQADAAAAAAATAAKALLVKPAEPSNPAGEFSGFKPRFALGSGQFGIVWLLLHPDGRKIVDKRVSLVGMSVEQKDDTHKEINLLRKLEHKYVVRYFYSYEDTVVEKKTGTETRTLHILMEYGDGGALDSKIADQKLLSQRFDSDSVRRWVAQLVEALDHIHQLRVIHRDLKAANILLCGSKHGGVAKLADFGISRLMSSQTAFASTAVGTPYYLAPELIRGEGYDGRADVWSLGVICYELLALDRPFKGENIAMLAMAITRRKAPPLPEGTPPDLHNFTKMILIAKDKATRPTAQELLRTDPVRGWHADWAAEERRELEAELCRSAESLQTGPPDTPPPTPNTPAQHVSPDLVVAAVEKAQEGAKAAAAEMNASLETAAASNTTAAAGGVAADSAALAITQLLAPAAADPALAITQPPTAAASDVPQPVPALPAAPDPALSPGDSFESAARTGLVDATPSQQPRASLAATAPPVPLGQRQMYIMRGGEASSPRWQFKDELRNHEVVVMCAGAQAAAVLTSDGDVFTWTLPGAEKLGWAQAKNPTSRLKETGLKAVALTISDAIDDPTMVIVAHGGGVYEWRADEKQPRPVPGWPARELSAGVSVRAIGCGEEHAVLVTDDGQAFAWGSNDDGQLGMGDRDDRSGPLGPMLLDEGVRVLGVSCTKHSTFLLTEDGRALSCGNNDYRQLGLGPSEELGEFESVEVLQWLAMPSDADRFLVQLVCAEQHGAACTSDGRVLTWGSSDDGRLGRNPRKGEKKASTAHARPAAVALIDADQRVCAITAGSNHTVAVTDAGALWMWGQLDNNLVYSTPTRAKGEKLGDAHFLRACASAGTTPGACYTMAVAIVPEPPDEEDWADGF